MKATPNNQAFFPLLLTFFFWGSVYVAGKMIAEDIPPQLLACLRCTVAMAPLLLMARGCLGTKIAREDWKYFGLVGFLGYFFTISLIQLGISLTGASMASLINALTPVSVTVMASLILKERITSTKVLCLVLALTGTAVVTSETDNQGDLLGIGVVLLAVLCWGAASVYMRRLTASYPPILVTTYSMAISLIFHIPAGIFSATHQPVVISPTAVAVVLYLGLIGSGLSQFTWTKCLSLLPASTCSLFYPLQPAFSALLGALILGEQFRPTFFIGLLLISADVILSAREAGRQAKENENSQKNN
ncbi:DMT family transporter [Oscillibacter sp.]|uniref:DMT family transporter n=1 Tax=Oscillibacter sp. TaxID=1945593 RepID=UPI00289819C2|nr:DMT family transporter [Oscillibacter sp.]